MSGVVASWYAEYPQYIAIDWGSRCYESSTTEEKLSRWQFNYTARSHCTGYVTFSDLEV
jgi:hypothetical protein